MYTHKQAAVIHSKRRAKERYGTKLSEDEYKKILDLVINKKVIKETFLSWNRIQAWVLMNGVFYRVVYDKKLNKIVTFLPK